MRDLDEFKNIIDEEDRQTAFEKFIRRQKVGPDPALTNSLNDDLFAGEIARSRV